MSQRRNFLPALLLSFLSLLSFDPNHSTVMAAENNTDFELAPAATLSLGTAKSANGTSIASRSMLVYAVDARLGYQLSGFVLALDPQFAFNRQLTSPSSVGNTNVYGTSFTIGAGLGYRFPFKVLLYGTVDFLSAYSVSKATTDNLAVSYSSGMGFRAKVEWEFVEHIFIRAQFQNVAYGKTKVGTAETDLGAANNKFSLNTYGLGVGYRF